MHRLKLFISFLLVLFSINASKAQDEDNTELQRHEQYNEVSTYSPLDTALEYNAKSIPPDSIIAIKNDKGLAYAKYLEDQLKSLQNRQQQSGSESELEKESWLEKILPVITQYFFWTLAVLFILFILCKLFLTKGFFQRQTLKNNVTILPDEEDLSMTADYDRLIDNAIKEKDYRLGVRYLYLKSLQKLSEKGVINFAVDKTNYQYVRELNGKAYKNTFATLTLNYEYVWYGEFDIDQIIFIKLQTEFKQFYNQI